jgi:hypothetical protein
MPDLLGHALLAYVICTALSRRYEWLTPGYVTVGMAGAFIPDMTKIMLVIPGAAVEGLVGVPFSWGGIHTAGGALIGILIGIVIVTSAERRRVGGLLAVGAASHLLADALLLTPTGRSYAVLWPLTRYHPPAPGLYLSTEPWPTVVLGVLAAVMWVVTRRRATG